MKSFLSCFGNFWNSYYPTSCQYVSAVQCKTENRLVLLWGEWDNWNITNHMWWSNRTGKNTKRWIQTLHLHSCISHRFRRLLKTWCDETYCDQDCHKTINLNFYLSLQIFKSRRKKPVSGVAEVVQVLFSTPKQ